MGIELRPHRHLHKIDLSDRCIDGLECGRVNHIFGVVQQDRPEAEAAPDFIGLKRGVEPVQTVRFGGRPFTVEQHQPHARVLSRSRHYRANCLTVVAVAADIDSKRLLRPDCTGVPQRCSDHMGFVPRRDQHGSLPL